jgi:hypothetical protein
MGHTNQKKRFIRNGNGLDLRHHRRRNAVRNHVGQSFLFGQHILYPDDPAVIGAPDNQCAAGCIGKGHKRPENRFRRREILFELKRLSFGSRQQLFNFFLF